LADLLDQLAEQARAVLGDLVVLVLPPCGLLEGAVVVHRQPTPQRLQSQVLVVFQRLVDLAVALSGLTLDLMRRRIPGAAGVVAQTLPVAVVVVGLENMSRSSSTLQLHPIPMR
jgi:hypothetical protein